MTVAEKPLSLSSDVAAAGRGLFTKNSQTCGHLEEVVEYSDLSEKRILYHMAANERSGGGLGRLDCSPFFGFQAFCCTPLKSISELSAVCTSQEID